MVRTVVFLAVLFVLLVVGCSNSKHGFDPIPYELSGTWEDHYTLTLHSDVGIPEDPYPGVYEADFVSVLNISPDRIRIRTYADSVSESTLGSDNKFVYSIRNDTLILTGPVVESPPTHVVLFHYELGESGLTLSEIPDCDENGLCGIAFISIPWSYPGIWWRVAEFKNYGEFLRIGA